MRKETDLNQNAGHKPGHPDPQPGHGKDRTSDTSPGNGNQHGSVRVPGRSHALPR